jgi:hypothetical protein
MHHNSENSGLGLEITGFSEATMGELPESTGDASFDGPEDMFERFESLLEWADRIEDDINGHFVDDASTDVDDLLCSAKDLAEDALALMHRLTNHAEHPLSGQRDFDQARYAVEMAISELSRQHEVLADRAMRESEARRNLAAAGRAKGVATKALVNVERALCDDTEFGPRLQAYLRLEDSLETRRAYGKMRRALYQFGRLEEIPPHDQVVARLRRAGTSFVHLRGHDCFEMLRVEDRFHFEELWERVYAWLRSESRDDQTYAGWLIWQDVINFIELLGAVNFRQELREHDVALAQRALDAMSGMNATDTVGPEIADDLHSLTGFGPAVDTLIEEGSEAPVGAWRSHLLSIRQGG